MIQDNELISPSTKCITINIKNKDVLEVKERNKTKKRVVADKWTFDKDYYYSYENQLRMMQQIQANKYLSLLDEPVSKIVLQQIQKKISGYKQQDLIKNKYREDLFLHLKAIIDEMILCELKCYYCSCEMDVLYDISREGKQWSVDRIDNDHGHNIGNFYLACLECNLKRRRRSDSKFLFTKQLTLVKIDG